MTTSSNAAAMPTQTPGGFRLPDPPEREPDEKMTSAKHLHEPGNTHHLFQHFGNPESTIAAAERYVTMMPERRLPSGSYRRAPDLLIALGVNRAAYYASNGYIVQEQGKPPDFVLEIASRSTGAEDTGPKREDYAALGIPEYWRFDETGEHHGARLAGERLVDGRYESIAIEELADGSLQGYSAVLNLLICWERGQLAWREPATGRHISTFESERARADAAEAARDAAESRVRELEARLRQQNPGNPE
jgi:hypothetical protein